MSKRHSTRETYADKYQLKGSVYEAHAHMEHRSIVRIRENHWLVNRSSELPNAPVKYPAQLLGFCHRCTAKHYPTPSAGPSEIDNPVVGVRCYYVLRKGEDRPSNVQSAVPV